MGWIRDEPKQNRRVQAAILAACTLGHLALGLWLMRDMRGGSHTEAALQVSFIPATPALDMATPTPPFPVAPQRATTSPVAARPRATPSAPPDRPMAPTTSPPPADLLRQPPSTARLLDAAEAAARAGTGNAMPAPRDPTQRRAVALPGREESFTPEAYVLRKEISPEDVVNAIGGLLFGGQVDPCPDTRSKIRDLVARSDAGSQEELRILIDRERRRCR